MSVCIYVCSLSVCLHLGSLLFCFVHVWRATPSPYPWACKECCAFCRQLYHHPLVLSWYVTLYLIPGYHPPRKYKLLCSTECCDFRLALIADDEPLNRCCALWIQRDDKKNTAVVLTSPHLIRAKDPDQWMDEWTGEYHRDAEVSFLTLIRYSIYLSSPLTGACLFSFFSYQNLIICNVPHRHPFTN